MSFHCQMEPISDSWALPSEEALFDIDKMVYCGEGNSTIVVSNTSLGWILRIRKVDGNASESSNPDGLSTLAQFSTSPQIIRYFGPTFTRPMHLLQTTRAFLLKLERKLASQRPEYRKTKGVDLTELCVIVAPDASKTPPSLSRFTFGPTISVEIKPKFGAFVLWPCTGLVNMAKTHACLFCLRQNHSGKLSRWRHPSNYCPCDLFSGNRERMIRSLYALLHTPQINLRIHLDGHVVFSHEYNRLPEGLTHFFGNNDGVSASYHTAAPAVNGLSGNGPHRSVGDQNTGSTRCSSSSCPFTNDCDRLIRGLLIDALLHELDPVQQDSISHASMYPDNRAALSFDCHLHQTSTRGTTDQPPSPSSPLPPEGSILGRVLSTQLISRMDICFITPHYERVCKCLSRLGISWNEYAQMPLERRSTLPFGSPDIVESFDIVEKYLIALIARDCSIMIPLQRATQNCPGHIPTVGGNCPCLPRMVMTPVIVDLDPKPLEKFCGRFTVEKSIAEQALQRCPEFLDCLTRTHPS